MTVSFCSALADLFIEVTWEKNGISHTERFLAENFNGYRDIFPGSVFEKWRDHFWMEDEAVWDIQAGEITGPYDETKVKTLPLNRLTAGENGRPLQAGRYYPQGWISGLPGVFRGNQTPFLMKAIDETSFTADLNHPLADRKMTLSAKVLRRSLKTAERGGTSTDWMKAVLEGPGMQGMELQAASEGLSGLGLDRRDNTPDEIFYRTDRLVHHIDDTARRNLTDIYACFIKSGDRVLDLMAGWESHLPETKGLASVHGLGLNAAEMNQNPRLTEARVWNLNTNPCLPYENGFFDTVVCSLSVEYLIEPVAVFKEVERVLKPGGNFVVGFSNRWFPEKAVRLWEDLHEFERMGLVLRYFASSGPWKNPQTFSVRGYPRPSEDRYAFRLSKSDPIYVVAAMKK